MSREQRGGIEGLQDVPVFYPTLEEMRDFNAYIQYIETQGAADVGLAKVGEGTLPTCAHFCCTNTIFDLSQSKKEEAKVSMHFTANACSVRMGLVWDLCGAGCERFVRNRLSHARSCG